MLAMEMSAAIQEMVKSAQYDVPSRIGNRVTQMPSRVFQKFLMEIWDGLQDAGTTKDGQPIHFDLDAYEKVDGEEWYYALQAIVVPRWGQYRSFYCYLDELRKVEVLAVSASASDAEDNYVVPVDREWFENNLND